MESEEVRSEGVGVGEEEDEEEDGEIQNLTFRFESTESTGDEVVRDLTTWKIAKIMSHRPRIVR